jgi:queuine tRNA-ribosyltransferase
MLDICTKLPATTDTLAESVRRTTLWAQRGTAAWKRGATALFGIVQGGLDERLREQSARELIALDLPGYAIGGLSVGESRPEMERFTRSTAALLPPEKPRYLMGVGTVHDLIVGIDAGIDMFDCVYPTRSGRHGRAITRNGEYNIRNAGYVRDENPVDPQCSFMVCTTFTRAYLAHLFRSEELLGPRLLSYHNLAALASLMADARTAIAEHRWPAFRDALLTEPATP